MIRCVLVATDGSDAARAAVDAAIELAQSLQPGAQLHAAAVVDYVAVPGILAKRPPGAPDLLAEQAEAALACATAAARAAGITMSTNLLHGEVVEALLECVAKIGADMLVAGAHGRNRLVRLVMGSVAERLVGSTTLPVLIVRSRSAEG